jgi:hypothetical protein
VKERPILFSAPMVRALLDGTKTQTRRIIKPTQPRDDGRWPAGRDPVPDCPYGQTGDRLWVRESWQAWTEFNNVPPREIPPESRVNYVADGSVWDAKKRPSMFMPRWASRITLEVVGVRVERLQDISETDAMAEGVEWKDHAGLAKYTARKLYTTLWLLINGLESWEANPWVWVVEFQPLPQREPQT